MISSRLCRNSTRLFGATILLAVLGTTDASAAPPSGCAMPLLSQLTPVVLDLGGAGPDYECRVVVEPMGNDDRIVSIDSESEEEPSISIGADREAGEDHSGLLGISDTGLGALYWGLGHPTRAWKIVLPVESD